MFILKSKETIKRAIERAKQVKPFVKVLAFGCYVVTNSKGDGTYNVLCKRDKLNNRIVACNCKAGEKGQVCFHSAAALALHVHMAKTRKQTSH